MMDIEQVCKDAIAVVERYITGDVSAYDMQDELYEAREAVDCAWDVNLCEVGEDRYNLLCNNVWHACDTAKNDERDIAKIYVDEFWELVK